MDSSHSPIVGSETRKALTFSLLMLIGTTGLAGALVWNRRAIALGLRIAPAGWYISFTPPRRWVQLPAEGMPDELAFRSGPTGQARRLLIVRRIVHPKYETSAPIAKRYLRELHYPGLKGLFAPAFEAYPSPSGPFEGAIVEDIENGTIVWAAIVDGEAYCVALIIDGVLAQGDRQLAKSVVDSVQYVR